MQHDDILSKRNVNPEILFLNRKVLESIHVYIVYISHICISIYHKFSFLFNFRVTKKFEIESQRNRKILYIFIYREIINSIARIGKLKS